VTVGLEPVPPTQLVLRADDDGEHQALAAANDAWERSLASPHTRRAYHRAVARILRGYGQITPDTLAELRDELRDEGRRPSTINQAMSAVVSCARWIVLQGFAPAELLPPLEAVPRVGERDDRVPVAPSPDQVQALLRLGPAAAFPDDVVRQAHASLVLHVLAGTGTRVAEAVAARRSALVDARPNRQLLAAAQGRPSTKAAATLEVIDGKGGVSRTVPAGAEILRARARLDRLLDVVPRAADPLIPALAAAAGEGRPVLPLQPTTTRTIARILERVGLALDIDRRYLHPHALRHAYALAQLDPDQRPDGRPLTLGVLQRRLGHASSATTARYLRAGEDPDLA
jgi:integrase